MDINENEICEHCKKKGCIIYDYNVEETVCNNCGFVYDKKIIIYENQEKNNENNEIDESKVNEDYEIDDEENEINEEEDDEINDEDEIDDK